MIDKSCSVVYQSKTPGNNNSLLQSNDSKAKYSDIAKRLSSTSTSNYHTFLATNRCKPTTTASVTIASNSCINHGASSSSSSLSCPFHGTQAHLCSSEARVLSRANKILMYVCVCVFHSFFFFFCWLSPDRYHIRMIDCCCSNDILLIYCV